MKTMGSTEKFCLQWNDFEANISSAFHDLKEEKDFSDVTLVCADQQVEGKRGYHGQDDKLPHKIPGGWRNTA